MQFPFPTGHSDCTLPPRLLSRNSSGGLPLMDDPGRANTECCVLLSLLGTKPHGPESLRKFYFLKAELLVEFIVRPTVDLDIRVDEVIERWTILLRRQCDVATGG